MNEPETRFDELVSLLAGSEVKFILVGGLAAVVHGSARATLDVDAVYSRDDENLRRLAKALGPYRPYPRGAPPGLPFSWDESTLRTGLNFTLTTAIGHLDLLGEVVGGGRYDDLLPFTEEIELFGRKCRCVTLERLIALKRAAGRPRDLQVIAELEVLLEERWKLDAGQAKTA